MKLFDLLRGVKIIESRCVADVDVDFIANDHRKIKKKTVFVAIKGGKRNGNDYVEQAIENGACAIVTEENLQPSGCIPCVLVDNVREALSKMWSNFYGNPSKSIKTVAITGTNGKTSSAFFLFNILKAANISASLISTIGCFINNEKIDVCGGGSVSDISSAMTTPDPEALYYLYNKMKENGVKIAVIEASSHALIQKRLCGIDVEIGAFTNLSREHLDFHGNLEEYFYAKEELFKICKTGIVNIDDFYGKRIKADFTKVYCYSVKDEADFYAADVNLSINGCKFRFVHGMDSVTVNTEIIGEFTVYNVMLAASCASLLGIDMETIAKEIRSTKTIKGRMERYGDKCIYIDYAHTPEAMKNAILTLKSIEKGKRLIALFGCGGDRDVGKRREMGEICTKYADFSVITSDNPRSENPEKIINDILKGVDKAKAFEVITNRRDAIIKCAQELGENDVLLLLGKGHEEYEITKEGKRFFSERAALDEVFCVDK